MTDLAPDTQSRILAAARSEFIAKGLAGARMQTIAAMAGVNQALLHYYFRTKEKLYAEVLDNLLRTVWGRLRERSLPMEAKATSRDWVRALVSTYLRVLAAHPEFIRFMLRELADGAPRVPDALERLMVDFGDVLQRMLAVFRKEIKAGRLQPIVPTHFVLNMMGMTVMTFLGMPLLKAAGKRMGFEIDLDDAFLEQREKSIVDTLFNGLEPCLPKKKEKRR